jgi:hypothetical protein
MYALLLLHVSGTHHVAHYIVPIVATVGLAMAGDTSVDDTGSRLACTCIHAWAVDAARVWKRTGGGMCLLTRLRRRADVQKRAGYTRWCGTTPNAESQAQR